MRAANDFDAQFFRRADTTSDEFFYQFPRLLTHIDDAAIAAVGALYEELQLTGRVLDLMGSWISHFLREPDGLVVLGLNDIELRANDQSRGGIVHDLNALPTLPLRDMCFDGATCCVSVDYLVRPVEVFSEVARVLRPGAPFVCTFSNRCFPTKAIDGWLSASDDEHCEIVAEYFRQAAGYGEPVISRRTPSGHRGDPLFGVWAAKL